MYGKLEDKTGMNIRDIRVSLNPNPSIYPDTPYFWWIAEIDEQSKEDVNSGLVGWAKTPQEAFEQAYQAHLEDIEEEEKEKEKANQNKGGC